MFGNLGSGWIREWKSWRDILFCRWVVLIFGGSTDEIGSEGEGVLISVRLVITPAEHCLSTAAMVPDWLHDMDVIRKVRLNL